MRTFRTLLILLAICCPSTLWAQSILNFPRALTPADRTTTGFAVLNPGPTSASVSFILYNTNGTAVASRTFTVPARGQLARLGSEVFTGVTANGWVQASSATPGLLGFWLGGDFSQVTDGSASAESYFDHVLPVVGNTEINIANTSPSSSVVATIFIFDKNGNQLATQVFQPLQPKAVFQARISEIFPTVPFTQATHVRISCSTEFATAALIQDFLVQPSWAVVNGSNAGVFLKEINFPHVISGDLGSADYVTTVSVTNLANQPQNVSFTFHPLSGSPTTSQAQIPANGTIRTSLDSLFGLSGSTFHDGWVQVTGDIGISGFVAYADLVQKGLAMVPVQTTARSQLMFSHIADLDPWLTGVALLNTTNTAAEVEVYALNPDGSLIGGAQNVSTARFTLAPKTKNAKLLSQWIPQTQTRTSDGGFVYVRSTNGVPLYGLELFFTRNLTVLANVAPGALDPSLNYSPPAP